MSAVLEMPATKQVIEIDTECFVEVVATLTVNGFKVLATTIPGRHRLVDELPRFGQANE